jgi:hypothetical protein
MSEIQWILEKLRAIVARVNKLDPLVGARIENGCSPDELEDLEGRLGTYLELQAAPRAGAKFSLPSEYQELLAGCRQVTVIPEANLGLVLFSPMTLAIAIEGFPHHRPRAVRVGSTDRLTEVQVVPIGNDGFGENEFLMGLSGAESGAVWKWTESCPPDANGVARDGITFLSPSLAGCLVPIVEELTRWCESRVEPHEKAPF